MEGADDYKSIYEVITKTSWKAKNDDQRFGVMPDLIVIDGGRDRISSAYDAMQKAEFVLN